MPKNGVDNGVASIPDSGSQLCHGSDKLFLAKISKYSYNYNDWDEQLSHLEW